MTPVSKLPRLVVLAAVEAGFDLVDLFCYSITPTQVALTLSGTGETVRVEREGLALTPGPSPIKGEGRKIGPAPDDTRSQAAPGWVEAGPPEGGEVPGPCEDSE